MASKMDLQNEFGRILESLHNNKTVEVKLTQLDSPEEFFVRGLVNQCLAHIDHLYWQQSVLEIIRELMRNAEQTVAKRNIDKSAGEPPDNTFKKIVNYYRENLAGSIKQEILFRVRMDENRIILDVANAGMLGPEDLNIIRERMEAGKQANHLSDADRGGGKGPGGLALCMITMKRSSIPLESLQVQTGNNVTMFSLVLSSNRETKEKLEYIEQSLLQEVDALPAIPETINKLIQLCESSTASMEMIANEISKDQAIAAEILKLANSGAFAGGKVGSVLEAAKIIGVSNITGLLLHVGAFRVLTDRYKHSHALHNYPVEIGRYSSYVAKKFQHNSIADRALTAGLLHHIGYIVMYAFMKEHTGLDAAMEDRTPDMLITMEELEWGISHATLGGILAEKWKFPEDLRETIQYHHAPHLCKSEHRSLTNIIYLADAVLHNQEHPENFYSLDPEVLRFFNLTSIDAFQMLCATLSPAEAKKEEEAEKES